MTRKPDDQPVTFRPAPADIHGAPTAPHQVAAPVAEEPAASPPVAEEDELVLGAETMVSPAQPAAQPAVQAPTQAPAQGGGQPRVFTDNAAPKAAPAQAPAAEERRPWLAPGGDAAAAPQPRVKLGGTLFERMSNAARGATRDDAEQKDEPIDIPRFLHRQNNQ